MSALQEAVDDYVAVRRSLGFKLKDYPWLLGDLVASVEAAGASTLTSELAVPGRFDRASRPIRRI